VRCAGAILLSGGALLLGRRAAHRSYPDCWDIIGGHVEPGETIEQALVREVEEEIGVTPVDFTRLTSLQAKEIELHIYRVDAWSGGNPTLLGDEHVELRWFAVEAACALPNLAAGEYRRVFRELAVPI
jgi:8-oxo-dGTP diphosphatase